MDQCGLHGLVGLGLMARGMGNGGRRKETGERKRRTETENRRKETEERKPEIEKQGMEEIRDMRNGYFQLFPSISTSFKINCYA